MEYMPITLKEFISKYNGKKIDFDNYAGGQCFDLYRQYVQEVLNFPQSAPTGDKGAKVLWTEFDRDPVLVAHYTKIPNTADFSPLEGDIMVWDANAGGGYGHVAVCTGENTGLQYFKSFDQNWSKISYCEVVNHSYKNVYGVLRPKVQNPDTIDVEKSVFEELVSKSTKYDEFERAGYKSVKDVDLQIETYSDRVTTLKKDHNNFLREMVTVLDPETKAEIGDQDLVKNLAKLRMSENSNLIEAKVKLERELEKKDIEFEEKIFDYEKQINGFKADLEEATLLIEKLKEKAEFLTKENQKLKSEKTQKDVFKSFVEHIFSFWKGNQ